jgi:hypothetical protein
MNQKLNKPESCINQRFIQGLVYTGFWFTQGFDLYRILVYSGFGLYKILVYSGFGLYRILVYSGFGCNGVCGGGLNLK